MSYHDVVAMPSSTLSAKEVDLHIVTECLQNKRDFFEKFVLGDQKFESANNTEHLTKAIQISNIHNMWLLVDKFLNDTVNDRPVREIITELPQYEMFCEVKDRLTNVYNGSGFCANNLQNALLCSYFPIVRKAVSRGYALAETNLSKTKKMELKATRIYMQAADFILNINHESHFEILLQQRDCYSIVRNFDTSTRMKISGLTQTRSEKGAIFEKITVRWFEDKEEINGLPQTEMNGKEINGLRQSEMKKKMIAWYECKLNTQAKYQNIAQVLETCDSIENHLIMISKINEFILDEDIASLFLDNDEDCDHTAEILSSMIQSEIRKKTISYMRNFAQPFLGMKNHNDIILGMNQVSYLQNWSEFSNRSLNQSEAWDKICEVYQKLMCMEKKTRKFFSILCQQNVTNYNTILALLNKRFRGDLSYDKLDQWLTSNDLSINNSEMSIKMFSTGGVELINYCMSSSCAFQRSVVGSIDEKLKISINGEFNYEETLNKILSNLKIRNSEFVQVVAWKFRYPVVDDIYADFEDLNDNFDDLVSK